jgi:hypothetical protein
MCVRNEERQDEEKLGQMHLRKKWRKRIFSLLCACDPIALARSFVEFVLRAEERFDQ